jgi:hypothetical protein
MLSISSLTAASEGDSESARSVSASGILGLDSSKEAVCGG